MSSRSCWNVSRSVWTNALRWVKNCSLRRWAVFDMLAAVYFSCVGCLSDSRVCYRLTRALKRSSPAVKRACRTGCVWGISPQSGTERPTRSSGQMEMPSRTWSSKSLMQTHTKAGLVRYWKKCKNLPSSDIIILPYSVLDQDANVLLSVILASLRYYYSFHLFIFIFLYFLFSFISFKSFSKFMFCLFLFSSVLL